MKDPDPVTGKIPCYYRSGFRTAPLDARMNAAAKAQKASVTRIAKAEARLIDRLLTGKKRDGSNRVTGRPLRLHVGGDTPTTEAAVIVAAAARRYSERVQAPSLHLYAFMADGPPLSVEGCLRARFHRIDA